MNEDGTVNEDDPAIDLDGHWWQVGQRRYDPDGEIELTTAIVYAIAEAMDRSPDEVKSVPLYEAIDAPALESTFFGGDERDQDRRGVGTVSFRYEEYFVKVRSDGWIQVYESTDVDP